MYSRPVCVHAYTHIHACNCVIVLSCIFAYGQTGSGKTFTIQGKPELPGIAPRAIKGLFALLSELDPRKFKFEANCYMCELYNNQASRGTLRNPLAEPTHACKPSLPACAHARKHSKCMHACMQTPTDCMQADQHHLREMQLKSLVGCTQSHKQWTVALHRERQRGTCQRLETNIKVHTNNHRCTQKLINRHRSTDRGTSRER